MIVLKLITSYRFLQSHFRSAQNNRRFCTANNQPSTFRLFSNRHKTKITYATSIFNTHCRLSETFYRLASKWDQSRAVNDELRLCTALLWFDEALFVWRMRALGPKFLVQDRTFVCRMWMCCINTSFW